METKPLLILASASPRRHELLTAAGIPHTVKTADTDESLPDGIAPEEAVQLLSAKKAAAVAPLVPAGSLVLAADTVVALDKKILGKPRDEADAYRMLHLLSGRAHQVMTGLTVLRGDRAVTCTEVTDIHFRPLSQGEIARYVATGEPMDKAGAYGIQGGAALFAENMQGDYYNVMGLPVCRLWQMLHSIAPELMEDTQ